MGDVIQFPRSKVNAGKPTSIICPHCGIQISREGFKTWSFWCKDGLAHGDMLTAYKAPLSLEEYSE